MSVGHRLGIEVCNLFPALDYFLQHTCELLSILLEVKVLTTVLAVLDRSLVLIICRWSLLLFADDVSNAHHLCRWLFKFVCSPSVLESQKVERTIHFFPFEEELDEEV